MNILKSKKHIGFLLVCILMLISIISITGTLSLESAHAEENASIFSFTPTSSTECSVRLLDKTVEKAIIPTKTTINGVEYTVTSITNNGFASAVNIKKIRLPQTLRTIGNTAFANCGQLKSITLPAVQSIGTSAFSNCTSLEYVIIPSSINLVAPTILRGCNTKVYVRISETKTQELGWATNWNANNNNQVVEYSSNYTPEVEYIEVFSSSTSRSATSNQLEVIGYYVDDGQPFVEEGRNDIHVYIPEFYRNKETNELQPVLGILPNAFEKNIIDNLTIGYASIPIHLDSYAFYELTGGSVTINRDINLNVVDWMGNNGLAESLFSGADVATIILPNTITAIGPSMFDFCTNLTDVHFVEPQLMSKDEEMALYSVMPSTNIVNLPTTITTIGSYAFSSITNIKEIFIPRNVVNVGESIFNGWNVENGQTVSIDYDQESDLPGWVEETNQGWHTYWKDSCDASIVEFQGIFTITYHLNGGTHSGNPGIYMPKDTIMLNDASKEGYTFAGWFDNASFSGDRIYEISKGSSGNKILYAKFNANVYKVVYNKNKPINASNSVIGMTLDSNHIYDSSSLLRENGYMLQGWEFVGWNTQADGNGDNYNDKASVLNLSTATAFPLFAQWEAKTYTVLYEPNKPSDATGVLSGNMGSSSHVFDNSSNLSKNAFILEGWSFSRWSTMSNGSGNSYLDEASILDLSTNSITLYAQWTKNTYNVILNKQGGSGGTDSVDATFDAPMPGSKIAPSRVGHTFNGYWSGQNGTGKQYYTASMSSVRNWDIASASTLYASWTGIPFTVTLNKAGGSGGTNSVTAICDASMPTENVLAPSFLGYDFNGYWSGQDGTGKQYYTASMSSVCNWDIASDSILYASWVGAKFSVTLDRQGGSGGTDSVTATYMAPMPDDKIAPNSREGLVFNGYWSGKNGTGKMYYDAQMKSVREWDIPSATNLYAHWKGITYTIQLINTNDNSTISIECEYDKYLKLSKDAFYYKGHNIDHWTTSADGTGNKYYSQVDIKNLATVDGAIVKLYSQWTPNTYTIIYHPNGGSGQQYSSTQKYNAPLKLSDNAFIREGYGFSGWSEKPEGPTLSFITQPGVPLVHNFVESGSVTLYAQWKEFTYFVRITSSYPGYPYPLYPIEEIKQAKYNQVFVRTAEERRSKPGESGSVQKAIVFSHWEVKVDSGSPTKYNGLTFTGTNLTTKHGALVTITACYVDPPDSGSCVAEGSLITLADGSQKAVELLTGNEQLLVWNLKTGSFDIAPILFIDSEQRMTYEVINLIFSDGTTVKVISEHAFWDINLNKYVFLRNDAAQYIGHWFNKQTTDADGNMTWTAVQLTDVVIANEVTTAWSPVTAEHLCYYVNGMLSMPGGTTGLINIFEVDAEIMQYDQETMQADIEEYGIFTYEEFAEILPVPQEIFDAFDAQYLKVAIGKGLITIDGILALVETYSEFLY